ncbi:hypothetical protein KSP40_PGU019117 [Platanthera guangdongensis]|uniref:Uncharacterized protein n=1 Tax=Platanthera guangdongensis TaxID=2320717 RepID=A0ABR2MW01_9ASPA
MPGDTLQKRAHLLQPEHLKGVQPEDLPETRFMFDHPCRMTNFSYSRSGMDRRDKKKSVASHPSITNGCPRWTDAAGRSYGLSRGHNGKTTVCRGGKKKQIARGCGNWDSEDDNEVERNYEHYTFDCAVENFDRDLEDEDEVEENYEHYNFHCAEEHPDLTRENKIEADEAQDDDDLGSSVALLSKCFGKL